MMSPEPVRRYGSPRGVTLRGRMALTALGWVRGGVGFVVVALGGWGGRGGWWTTCAVSSADAENNKNQRLAIEYETR